MTVELTNAVAHSKLSILNLFFLELNNTHTPQTRTLSSVVPNFAYFRMSQILKK